MNPDKTTQDKPLTVIKKYANRRLYHTGTSTYVTLEDLAQMIQKGDDFTVQDARTGDDITRSVLTQIIFEQESKGTNLLPIAFLRQLIRFYGDSLQAVVPSYLDNSMQVFASEQVKFREQMAHSFGPTAFQLIEEQTRQNMVIFKEAMRMFSPFAVAKMGEEIASREAGVQTASVPEATVDLNQLKGEIADMQRKIEALSRK